MNIETAIIRATKELKKIQSKSPGIDSEIIMSKVINKSREYVILNPNIELKKENLDHFEKLVSARLKGKPIAYITGKKFFWKSEFIVNKNALIPRPDTEIIIEKILEIFKNKDKLRFLDIGIGTGCIILSLLKEKKKLFWHWHRYQ